jgi:tetratricopeptide (TPR) repeat protein
LREVTDKILQQNTLTGTRAEFARRFEAKEYSKARTLALSELARAETPELQRAWRNNWAMCERAEGNLDLALQIHEASEELPCADAEILAKHHTGLGITCRRLGERDQRKDYLDRALIEYTGARAYYEEIKDPFTASIDNNVSMVMIHLGRAEETFEVLKQAREVCLANGFSDRAAECDDTLSKAHLAMAKFHAERAARIAGKLKG